MSTCFDRDSGGRFTNPHDCGCGGDNNGGFGFIAVALISGLAIIVGAVMWPIISYVATWFS